MGQSGAGRLWPATGVALHLTDSPHALEARFVAPHIIGREDVAERQTRIAGLVSGQIIPRLVTLHRDLNREAPDDPAHPSDDEFEELAHLVLSPDPQAAAAYVVLLRERGLGLETLFVELLEPAARHLGEMWERDECDFIDVTLGVGRLQKLLAVFNATHDTPAFNERRAVLLLSMPGEQHGFGLSMVTKFLEAGGWQVAVEHEATPARLTTVVKSRWLACAGITMGGVDRLTEVAAAIQAIRAASLNPAIGIMVGGPAFNDDPSLVQHVGADGTAANAPTSVLMAQKLFDRAVAGPSRILN